MQKNLVALLALAAGANAGAASLKDIKHVIMLMMENRSFQHVSLYTA
jgi:phospholipase C